MSGEATFPTIKKPLPGGWPGAMTDYLRAYSANVLGKLEAEAWAWRCADTMPDSAQGRMDAKADALSLERAARTGYDFTADGRVGSRTVYATLKASMAGLAGQHELFSWEGAHRAPAIFNQAAHAAFRACPGLR